MMAQFSAQFIIIFILTLIPLILSQCSHEVDNCFIKFSADLETHKRHQFLNTDNQINDICNQETGYYYKFVQCIVSTEQLCASDTNFKSKVCETRKLKMRVTRFNWKPTFFDQLCQNTSSELSQGFFKHEECISNVFNTRKWKCEVNYYNPIKAMRNWKQNINLTCSLWKKFRECSRTDIKLKCGTEASNVSDYLFHSYQSYFEKYNTCQLEGMASDQCWYEILKAPASDSSTQTSVISTTSDSTDPSHPNTNDMRVENIDSNKSFELIDSNESTDQTKSLEMKTHFNAINETNDLSDEESDPNSDQSFSHSSIRSTNGSLDSDSKADEENEDILADNESNRSETSVESNEKNIINTEQLTSGASTDSVTDKYFLIIPVILILFIKLFV